MFLVVGLVSLAPRKFAVASNVLQIGGLENGLAQLIFDHLVHLLSSLVRQLH